jgi:phage tail-like protein
MARSSSDDPVEKFRFRVTVISLDLSVTAAIETIAGLSAGSTAFKDKLAIFSRAGFSSVTMPKANIGEMTYRENIDNLRSIKVAGLAKFDPITLTRGVTKNRDMYEWYRLVNEEIALLSVAGELARDTQFSPAQSDNYRKDVILEVLDRQGQPIKAWYLFNAWPSVYNPGNDLNASSEEKLIESLTLTYEYFIELEGGPDGFAKEIAKGLAQLAVGAGLNAFDSATGLTV